MANEIQLQTSPVLADANAQAIVRNAAGLVWNGSAFVAYVSANVNSYKIALTEQGTSSGFYVGNFPTGITTAGIYTVVVYDQAGASLSESDEVLGTGNIEWDGSAAVTTTVGDNLITLAYLKTMMGIAQSNTTFDALLNFAIAEASGMISTYCNRSFKVTSYSEYHDPAQNVSRLVLKQRPVTALTKVTLYPHETTAEEFASSDFIVDGKGGMIQFKLDTFRSFPCGFQTALVEYSAGYASIPADLQAVCAMLAAKVYYQSGKNPNVVSEKLGDWQATYKSYAEADTLFSADLKNRLINYRSLAL